MTTTHNHPPITTHAEWLAQRLELLAREKALTREHDRVAALRRRLPMVRIEKDYWFEGASGRVQLRDLFEGRQQLIVYHFMFDPNADRGCPGCTGFVASLGDLTMLNERNTTFALISRAPRGKLEEYRQQHGWKRAWYSSFGSDFNYDFHATLDPSVHPVEYNYKRDDELPEYLRTSKSEEAHGLSVFFRVGEDVFHTYSTYGRGVERLTDAYALLDVTPYGRQEDWEDSPTGWPQRPTYG
jgi:predicted dithiol-disulfide oxidoreductase (DUF899 family)